MQYRPNQLAVPQAAQRTNPTFFLSTDVLSRVSNPWLIVRWVNLGVDMLDQMWVKLRSGDSIEA